MCRRIMWEEVAGAVGPMVIGLEGWLRNLDIFPETDASQKISKDIAFANIPC